MHVIVENVGSCLVFKYPGWDGGCADPNENTYFLFHTKTCSAKLHGVNLRALTANLLLRIRTALKYFRKENLNPA